MAKSLRSKWVRKMKAIKRVRYGEKEKARLINMINAAKAASQEEEKNVESQFITIKPAGETSSSVETDVDMKEPLKYDPKTLKDQHGTYPAWMNQRQMRKMNRKNIKIKRKATKAKNKSR